MSAAFTRGPWRAHNLGIVSEGASCVVAVVHWRGEELEAEDAANMHLIAAAPELYAALEKMLEWNARESDHAVSFDERVNLCDEAFCMARAALKAARGEA